MTGLTADRRVGIAISGGGHRATVWGLGTLIGFLRARDLESRKPGAAPLGGLPVVSVASVSGGSIANGVVACAEKPLNQMSPEDLTGVATPGLRLIAEKGLIPGSGSTLLFVVVALGTAALGVLALLATLGAIAGSGRNWPVGTTMVPPVALGLVLGSLLVRRTRRLRVNALLVGAGLAVGASFGAGSLLARKPSSGAAPVIALAVAAGVVLLVGILLLNGRDKVAERALAKDFFARAGGAPTLEQLKGLEVHHVFCATELQTAHQIYLTPRILSSWLLGHTTDTGSVSLAQAVQASAALPGGFAPQETRLSAMGIEFENGEIRPARLVMVDGGVYDNMADQWEEGLHDRVQRFPRLAGVQPHPADFLIVANAGKALGPRRFTTALPLWREVRGLLRDQQIQYEETTAPRSHALVQEFHAAESVPVGNRSGVIVAAGTSPMSMANTADPDAAKAERAKEWQEALARGHSDAAGYWAELARHNAGIETTLSKLGLSATLDLLEHSIVLTQTALHVHYGIGSVDVVDREELKRIFAGRR